MILACSAFIITKEKPLFLDKDIGLMEMQPSDAPFYTCLHLDYAASSAYSKEPQLAFLLVQR